MNDTDDKELRAFTRAMFARAEHDRKAKRAEMPADKTEHDELTHAALEAFFTPHETIGRRFTIDLTHHTNDEKEN